ncbi:hypothetical protein RND71_041553 [Anisodus tanguticus]|uniref:Uncharacterized protein n=1 Tax=Anisodus tanguticus TaxID=243964 RepID=A0AAE1UUE6_9SOLA|nr:hypothetical protein RND71_041553 [Anisodus tanguticus]
MHYQDQVIALKQMKVDYVSSVQTDREVWSNAEMRLDYIPYMTPEKACALPNRNSCNCSCKGKANDCQNDN